MSRRWLEHLLLAIGEYEIVESKTAAGLPVTLAYSKRADTATARMSVDRTAEIVSWEESVFGPYPFEAIGGVVGPTDGINYPMEMQTRPIYPTRYFGGLSGRSGDSVVAHENAHQWFGDSTAVAHWKDVWLSEGFATYAEWLYSEAHGNGTAQELFDTAYSRNAVGAPFWQVVIGHPGAAKVFDQAVYDRGAMTLHQLRLAVGDDKFYEILRTWADTRRYGNGSIEDFIALSEKISATMLKGFSTLGCSRRVSRRCLDPAPCAARAAAPRSRFRSHGRPLSLRKSTIDRFAEKPLLTLGLTPESRCSKLLADTRKRPISRYVFAQCAWPERRDRVGKRRGWRLEIRRCLKLQVGSRLS